MHRWRWSIGGAIAVWLALVSPAAAQDAIERLYGRPIGALRFEIEGRPVPSPAAALETLVREVRPRAQIDVVTSLGAVIGAHAGPGTVGFFWFDDVDSVRTDS
jgi:hypothetical protein